MHVGKVFQTLMLLMMCGLMVGVLAFLIYVFPPLFEPKSTITPTPSLEPFLAATMPPKFCVVTSDALNVRIRPSENSTAIYWLVQNDVVPILDDQQVGSWVRVQIADMTGWVNSHYCAKGK